MPSLSYTECDEYILKYYSRGHKLGFIQGYTAALLGKDYETAFKVDSVEVLKLIE